MERKRDFDGVQWIVEELSRRVCVDECLSVHVARPVARAMRRMER